MREQSAGAAHAALYLVVNEQQTELVADGAQALEVIGGRRPHAAFALHRSTRIAAVLSFTAARISLRLLNATWSNPSMTGPKPLR